MIAALVLLALLALSVLSNIGFFMGDLIHLKPAYSRTAGPRLEEVVLEDHSADQKIAVVELDGLILDMTMQGGYSLVDLIKAQLNRAKEDRRVRAVLFKVNSPGGEVLASDEISRAIADFQEKSGKPVIASMGSLAASGGYYVSSPCRWIVANELTITGSIGVILSTWNYRGLMNKVGVRPLVFKSGKFKDMLSGSKDPDEITDAERQMMQDLIDETYKKFKSVVAKGRETAAKRNGQEGQKLSAQWEEFADGRVLSGSEAHKLGFVDELGNFDTAVKRAKDIARIPNANLIEYQQRIEFADLFRVFGQSDAKTVKLDLGFELPKLRAGQLYFLSPNLMH